MTTSAPIFDVQSLATQDGPGLRTAVFMQGCPLRCTWCSNPEGQVAAPQLMWQAGRCRGCGSCARACGRGAVEIATGTEARPPRFGRAACRTCPGWECVEACPAGALRRVGRQWSAAELVATLQKDVRLFRNSGGGVTFTGGEPLLHSEFLRPVLEQLGDRCISTAVETCGYWDWAEAADCLERCDLIYFDVKTLDDEEHQRVTGRSNELILRNLGRVAQRWGDRVIVTIPVIPGVLDSPEAIAAVGAHLRGLGLQRTRLLPYHRLGMGKYAGLGRPYPHEAGGTDISSAALKAMAAVLAEESLDATVEGWG